MDAPRATLRRSTSTSPSGSTRELDAMLALLAKLGDEGVDVPCDSEGLAVG